MDLTIADRVKLDYFENPLLLHKWALKRNLLENSQVQDRLLQLNKTSKSENQLSRYEQVELSLLPNRHFVEEWAVRNNKLDHVAVKKRIDELETQVRLLLFYGVYLKSVSPNKPGNCSYNYLFCNIKKLLKLSYQVKSTKQCLYIWYYL